MAENLDLTPSFHSLPSRLRLFCGAARGRIRVTGLGALMTGNNATDLCRVYCGTLCRALSRNMTAPFEELYRCD